MKATVSDLHRKTAKLVGQVIRSGQSVEITQHGLIKAKITPIPKPDRKAAWKALMEIGPVEILPRK